MARSRQVSIEQVEGLPDPLDTPENQLFVKFGCAVCESGVCFRADGINSIRPQWAYVDDGARDLFAVVGAVKSSTLVSDGLTVRGDQPCETPCRDRDDITAAVGLLNNRFGANLRMDKANLE